MNKPVVIVGEAFGEQEARLGRPFVGPSGGLLKAMLAQVGIPLDQCLLTNVFNFQPLGNDLKSISGPKAEGIPNYPSIAAGKYINAKHWPELVRLYKEIKEAQPNLVIALGGTASWAMLRASGIRNVRGATTASDPFVSAILSRTVKVLPTYHPAAVLREYTLRPIVLSDLNKASREMLFPEVRRPQRSIWIEPTIADLYEFERRFILPTSTLSIDVETKGDQITCFGVAPSPAEAIVVPLFIREKPIRNYWSYEDEVLALQWIRKICLLPNPKVGQNFLYDLRFLWEKYGIPVANVADDTMLLHHALQPEMEKGLGFLASLYTQEASWKMMRSHALDTNKTED